MKIRPSFASGPRAHRNLAQSRRPEQSGGISPPLLLLFDRRLVLDVNAARRSRGVRECARAKVLAVDEEATGGRAGRKAACLESGGVRGKTAAGR